MTDAVSSSESGAARGGTSASGGTRAAEARSLRRQAALIIGGALALLALVLFAILYTGVPGMLRQAEDSYLRKQLEVVSGLFRAARENAYMMADDLGIWDETVRFAEGGNPDFIKNNWPDSSPLHNYRFNLLIFKDRDGKDLYVEGYDYVNAAPRPVPDGLSDKLTDMAAALVRERQTPLPADTPVKDIGKGGIMFYEGQAYFVAAMPIMASRETGGAVGTAILGTVLSSDFFRNLTRYRSVEFSVLKEAPASGETPIYRESADAVVTVMPLKTLDGGDALLTMRAARGIYTEGMSTFQRATLLLSAALILFGVCLYRLFIRRVLGPVEKLSRDLQNIEGRGGVDEAAYAGSREVANLCRSMNDMLRRLDQSRVSMDVFTRVLDGIDASICVVDPATDAVLFASDKRRSRLRIEGEMVGGVCWQVMREGMSSRCEPCPLDALKKDPDAVLDWEMKDAAGHRLHHTARAIHWTDGRLVHMQVSTDVTALKHTEENLARRLAQEELMTAISQIFIASGDETALFGKALRMAGEFMGISKILLARREGDWLVSVNEWYTSRHVCMRPDDSAIPFAPGTVEYNGFIRDRLPHITYNDIYGVPGFEIAQSHGVRAVVGVPVFAFGEFWGMLSFNDCENPRSWEESDIQLVRLIATVISGVLERERMAEKLVRMSSIVDSAPQFISYITGEGGFEYINPGGLAMLGYTEEELMEKGIDALFSPESLNRVRQEIIPRVLAEGRCEFELAARAKNGGERMLAYSAFKTTFKSEGVGAIASDITKRVLLEKALVRARDQAEKSSRAKGEFLSRMSHEMRTPLNAIIGMTNIARSSADAAKKEYCLDRVDEASKHLLGVINDILDMSKIEADKFELALSEFSFETMLMRAVAVVTFRVEEKNQTLLVDVNPDVPARIVADEQRLTQVVANLLSNAVKFTPEKGLITLRAAKTGEADGMCELRVDVADTGIGIAKEHQEKLFHSFEQADGGIARKFGGTGLGLAISRRIVEMMDGRIWVESEEEQGATFSFTIRAKTGKRAPGPLLGPDVRWDDLRILAVDDAPEVRRYFSVLAEKIGLDCDMVEDGFAACRLVEAQNEKPYTIVFADWMMPGMDGIELTRRIKAGRGSETVVIMISATRWGDIEEEARAAGVDKFVPKPLFSSAIVNCINECLSPGKQAHTPETATPAAEDGEGRFAGRRVLLAEDIAINREIVIALLESTGLVVECAENGREAVDMFSRDPRRYDMIFMDIHMPEVDGYEATRRIRVLEDDWAAVVPIVAMTANVFREDVERCYKAGMDDHIGKPIDTGELFRKIESCLAPFPAAATKAPPSS